MKCASEKWKEVFVVNELSFEPLKDSCTSDRDTPIYIDKDVLKYPEQVREFMEDGYWWENGGDPDCVRPGKSFDFGPNTEIYFIPLVEQFRILSPLGFSGKRHLKQGRESESFFQVEICPSYFVIAAEIKVFFNL